MKVNVIVTPHFQREARQLMKKYRSLHSELRALDSDLQENPRKGTLIGRDVYKIRLLVKSKGRGKSGGLRVVSYVAFNEVQDALVADVYLLSIYDKSETGNIPDSVLKKMVADIQGEKHSEEGTDAPE